jgi:hypothetical protein
MLLTALAASLAACGGGDIETSADVASSDRLLGSKTVHSSAALKTASMYGGRSTQPTTTTTPTTSPTTTTTPQPVAAAVTTVQLISTATVAQTNAAATFGQVFAQGDIPAGETVAGQTPAGVTVPLQVDVKARHPDGSLRHAVITAQLPNAAAGQAETVNLVRSTAVASATQTSPAALLNNGFTASFTATVAGVQYTASADALLKTGNYTTWLSGPLVNEWMVHAPLKTAAGVDHPHLVARFAIRSYAGNTGARVDVTIENGWSHEVGPSNFLYDAQMLVGGQAVYTQAGLNHYHHARWRKLFWWGQAPKLDVRHNSAYLFASKAVPNYDQSVKITETALTSWANRWNTAKTGPMQPGVATAYMPATGGRSDIGPMPAWNAVYLMSMDQRAKNIATGMSDHAGGWPVHYRNKATGRPVTLADFPYMTILAGGAETKNPATGKWESFPTCSNCWTPMHPDTSHQPAFSYVPYLTTGDYYHLEELQFWANWSSFYGPPAYREWGKGLVKSDQIRAQAWTLRTLAEAAYITPDNDPQKANFTAMVNNNIDWFNANYTNNAAANKLGVLSHGYAIIYNSNTGLAPWQDDFFTTSVGRMVDLGFSKAQPLLTWKSKFVVDRMVGGGYCWVMAPNYSLKVRDTTSTAMYSTIDQVYKANNSFEFTQLGCGSAAMGTALKLRTGEMVGSVSPFSTQAQMQPALAYSVGVNATGSQAWSLFAARPWKPDFTTEPQFAIVPR